MQITRLPPGDTSKILQIRNLSAMKVLDHQVETDDLSEVWIIVEKKVTITVSAIRSKPGSVG